MTSHLVKKIDKDAIVYKGIHYSYSHLLQYSLLYSEYFTENDATPKKVLIFSENTPEYIFAIYGALRIGATVVPVDVMSTHKELRYMINDCRPDIIVVPVHHRELVDECVADIEDFDVRILMPEELDTTGVDEMPVIDIPMGHMDTTVAIIYTSGTTGSPKGVMLSYRNFWYNIDAVINQVKIFDINSNVILLLPLHHVFPFAGSVLAPLQAGGTIHIAENLVPDTIIRTLQEGKITIMIGVPRLYEALAKGIMNKIKANPVARMLYSLASVVNSQAFSKKIFKSVHDKFGGHMQFFVSGGAALPIETAKIFKTLGFYVLEGYGMTECAPMIGFTRPGEWAIGYCGRMLPGCELKIEESGELCVRGANVMQGYYNRPEETAEIIRDGWLHTGDTGEYDPVRGVKITGRIKEIIVTPNGKNINPAEIENEITQTSQAIKEIAVFLHEDMLQALVYPDMNFVRSNTSVSIDESVRQEIEEYNKSSMSYKRIMRFHIISNELPKTRLGKIQRFKLEELISDEKKEEKKEDISNRSETFKLLKEFVDNETNNYANGDSHFEIDLALDSLGRISLLAFIEETFGVVIAEEQMSELSTLNLLSAYVEAHSSATNLTSVSWKEIFEASDPNMVVPKSGFLHWFMYSFIKLFFHVFYRFRSEGLDQVPNVPCIFVANHRSGFDGVFVTSKLKWNTIRNTFFFAKDKHFQSSWKQFMARNNNVILMNINSNVKESLQQMYQVLKKGNNIIIFPEGTRSKDGSMKDFKESFAILSESLSVPVVPIAISGGERATHNKVRFPRFMASIKVKFLKPMLAKPDQTPKQFKDEVASKIAEALK